MVSACLFSSSGCIALNVFCPKLVLPDWKSHMVLQTMFPKNVDCFNFPMGSLPVYTRIFQNEYICNASVKCVKQFVCAVTSSSCGPVSDAPCEVSPVLFLHLSQMLCFSSHHSEPRNPAHDTMSVSAALSSHNVSQHCLSITMPQMQILSAHFVLTKCCHLFC